MLHQLLIKFSAKNTMMRLYRFNANSQWNLANLYYIGYVILYIDNNLFYFSLIYCNDNISTIILRDKDSLFEVEYLTNAWEITNETGSASDESYIIRYINTNTHTYSYIYVCVCIRARVCVCVLLCIFSW